MLLWKRAYTRRVQTEDSFLRIWMQITWNERPMNWYHKIAHATGECASMPMADLDNQIRVKDFPKVTQDGWSQNPSPLLDSITQCLIFGRTPRPGCKIPPSYCLWNHYFSCYISFPFLLQYYGWYFGCHVHHSHSIWSSKSAHNSSPSTTDPSHLPIGEELAY